MFEEKSAVRGSLGRADSLVRRGKTAYSRLIVPQPVLIMVRQGSKTLRWAGNELVLNAGGAAALAGGQTFDAVDEPDSDGLFCVRQIAFGQETVERFAAQYGTAQTVRDAAAMHFCRQAEAAFDHAAACLADEAVPPNAVETALHGLLAWLQHLGWGFMTEEGSGLVRQIRKIIAADTAFAWTAEDIAARVYCSESRLRRRLAEQGTSFRTLLADVRMIRALTLLQTTEQPVAQIAYQVGYESPARFTARFKERFGFLPSEARTKNGRTK